MANDKDLEFLKNYPGAWRFIPGHEREKYSENDKMYILGLNNNYNSNIKTKKQDTLNGK